jgi:two-component system, repressor protein LuxO
VCNIVVLHDGDRVEAAMLPPALLRGAPLPDAPGPPVSYATRAVTGPPLPEPEIMPLAEMEKRTIQAALQRTGNDVTRAAALLEVNPSTIYRKLQSWRTAS